MTDNYTTPAGSGGNQYRSLDVAAAGVHYPAVKISLGTVVDNFLTLSQAVMASSLPVVLASDHGDIKITLDSEAVVLGAGTASIGKLAANSGVDIGDVDVLSLPALPAGANTIGTVNIGTIAADVSTETTLDAVKTAVEIIDDLVLTEDVAHVTGDKGVLTFAVRTDSRASLVSATGDNSPLQVNASGDLRVDGSAVTQPVSVGSLPLPSGAATSAGQLADGHNVTVDNASIAITVASLPLPTGAALDATLVTIDTSLNNIEAAVKTDGSTKAAVAMQVAGEDGTNTQTLKTDTDGHLQVDVLSGGGGGTQYAEDTVSSEADLLTMAGVVRKDSVATLVDTDGDRTQMQVNGIGQLHVADVGITGIVTATLAAGMQLIGSVNLGTTGDIATETTLVAQSAKLPATLGQTTKAASMAVTLASDEDNVNVDATSVIPGTGAANLGKAIDSAAGATDTGVAMLAKHQGDTTHVTVADNDYDVLRIAEFGGLHVNPEQHHVIDEMDATTGWSALGNDTLNLALTNIHVLGTGALSFDKVNGAADTVFAGIEKTISSTNFDGLSPHDILQTVVYASSMADVSYVFLRLGTNSSNYNEWRIDGTDLSDAIWETLLFEVGDAAHSGATGTGVNWAAVTYCAIGLAFNAETDTLAGILFDEISFHTNQHVNATINAEVTSSVSSANINVQKIGNKAVNTQGGNVQQGTQRVTIATDDVNLAAIKTAVEGTLTIDGSGVTQPVSAASLPLPSGAATSAAQLADGHNVTVDNAAGASAVNIQDGGNAITVDNGGTFAVQSTLAAGTAAFGKLSANSGVDIGDVDVTSQPARVATTDTITAKLATDAIQNGTTALTPKFAIIDAATSGNNTIVAAVGGKKIRVLAYTMIASGDVDVRWESGANGTALSGQMEFAANGGASVAFCPVGHFESASGVLLNLELSAAVSVDGHITYIEV